MKKKDVVLVKNIKQDDDIRVYPVSAILKKMISDELKKKPH